VQDLDPSPVGSFWGEVNATVHLSLGCVGVVTNGGVRDLEEVRSLGFGYYASCVLVSHGYIHVEEVGTPVTIAGLTVNPRDLLAADQHGVVSIPLEIAERLPAACAHAAAAERPVLDPCERVLKEGKLADVDDLVFWRAEMVKLRNSFSG
jgi:regulator of RNase E activity RraA